MLLINGVADRTETTYLLRAEGRLLKELQVVTQLVQVVRCPQASADAWLANGIAVTIHRLQTCFHCRCRLRDTQEAVAAAGGSLANREKNLVAVAEAEQVWQLAHLCTLLENHVFRGTG
jgi:hypothetical protein